MRNTIKHFLVILIITCLITTDYNAEDLPRTFIHDIDDVLMDSPKAINTFSYTGITSVRDGYNVILNYNNWISDTTNTYSKMRYLKVKGKASTQTVYEVDATGRNGVDCQIKGTYSVLNARDDLNSINICNSAYMENYTFKDEKSVEATTKNSQYVSLKVSSKDTTIYMFDVTVGQSSSMKSFYSSNADSNLKLDIGPLVEGHKYLILEKTAAINMQYYYDMYYDVFLITFGAESTLPSLSVTQDISYWTNSSINLNISATDASGIKYIRINGIEYLATMDKYQVTQNGVYTVVAEDIYKNKYTLTKTVNNIDVKKPQVNIGLTIT